MQSAHSHRATSNPNFLPIDMAIPVPEKIILHRPPQSALQHPFHLNSPIQQSATCLWYIFNTLSFFQGSSWPRRVCEGLLLSIHPEKQEAGCWNSQPWMLCVWQCSCVVVTSHFGSELTPSSEPLLSVGLFRPEGTNTLLQRRNGLVFPAQNHGAGPEREPWRPQGCSELPSEFLLLCCHRDTGHFWLSGNLCSSSAALGQWVMGTRGASAKAS